MAVKASLMYFENRAGLNTFILGNWILLQSPFSEYPCEKWSKFLAVAE